MLSHETILSIPAFVKVFVLAVRKKPMLTGYKQLLSVRTNSGKGLCHGVIHK